jgi:hypothetical protein
MVIDFHVHFFPDGIALKTTKELSRTSGFEANGDGTVYALRRFMKEDGVDLAVNLPIATKLEQVESINRRMAEFNRNSKDVIAFGTMHPLFPSLEWMRSELDFLVANGIRGIKMHPEYQEFHPDDPKMTEFYEYCAKLGLILVFHAGRDAAFPSVRATPKGLAEVAKVKNLKLVLAHMAGYRMWDDVEQYLVGIPDIYFDTAFTAEMENWQMKQIILGHGAYKILFASDFPWQRPATIITKIRELGLGKDFEDWILYKNAKQLLKL